jgi:hypothetical protein
MSLEIAGKLLIKYDTTQVSEKFKKREFVLELAEEINGNIYTNYAKMQLVQNKCEIIDRFNPGDAVKVSFNIKGNKWEKDGKVNYLSNLDAWRIEYANNPAPNNNAGNNNYNPQANNQQQPNYNNGGNSNNNNNYNQQQPNNYNQQAPNNNNYHQGGNQGFAGNDQGTDDLPF